jgi:PqqD family protein of HPr-rel-A system
MTAPIKPRSRTDLTVIELDGEAVIYDDRNEQLHHLNPTATLVFKLCDGTATMKQTATELASAFSAPPDVIEQQVRKQIGRLRRYGLLEASNSQNRSGNGDSAAH